MFGRVASVMATLLAMAGPSDAEDQLFDAMSRLVSAGPAAQPLQGELIEGSRVDLWNASPSAYGEVLSPGPTPCVLEQLSVSQIESQWTQVSTIVYDFAKITGVRYLADADDPVTGSSRLQSDPAITGVSLDGEGWHCQRVVHIDPAAPRFFRVCSNDWFIVMLDRADRVAVDEALDVVGRACFASPKASVSP